MSISSEKLKEIQDLRDKCSGFIKNITFPIKKQHSDEVEKYLDRFIKFPALASIVSILFTPSGFVQTPELAIIGTIIILTSSILALNIFRISIQKDKVFIKKIKKIEDPMIKLGTKLTVFSRDQHNMNKEKDLLEAYNNLDDSYTENSLEGYNDNTDFIYKHVNISFWLLVSGVILSVLSIFRFC
jgi:hypothetical protein